MSAFIKEAQILAEKSRINAKMLPNSMIYSDSVNLQNILEILSKSKTVNA